VKEMGDLVGGITWLNHIHKIVKLDVDIVEKKKFLD